MSNQTSKELETQIKAIEGERDSFMADLQEQLQVAERERFTDETQDKLKTQIQSAKRTYEDILEPKRKQLETVRAAETEQAIRDLAAIEARAADVKEEIRSELRVNWVNAGGSLDIFDAIFETQLYPQEMARRAAKVSEPDKAAEEQARRREQNMINDAFSRF